MALNTLTPNLFCNRPNFVKINLKDISTCACDDDSEANTLAEREPLESTGSILVAYGTRKFTNFDTVGGNKKSRHSKSAFAHVRWNLGYSGL